MIASLEELSAGARSWLSRNVDYLDPTYPHLPVTPKAKACLELGLLHMLWTRLGPKDAELARITEAVHKIWQDPDFPRQVAASPKYFPQYGLIYGALAPTGITDGFHKKTLEELAPGGYLKSYGKSPYLRLETRYYADLAGLRHDFESYEKLYEASLLANRTEALPIDIEDAYIITHTLFHISDFGHRGPILPDHERERVYGLVDRLTDHFVEIDHWDLTAEFLMVQTILGADPTRTRSGVAAIRRLREVQASTGAIPARFAARRPSASDSDLTLFKKAYHTTLVTAIASMMIFSALRGR